MPISRPIRPFAQLRQLLHTVTEKLWLFSGWTWVAAGSLVGFEVFEIIFTSFALAPELLPVVLVVMALAYVWRERLASFRQHLRIRRRAARVARHAAP